MPVLKKVACICLALVSLLQATRADERADFFERRVRPILAANCYPCHGEKKQESELRLDSREAIIHGGAGGLVVETGMPHRSRLLQAIRWDGELKMPPEKKLRDEEIAILTEWVSQGFPWPQSSASTNVESWRAHWSFQPVSRPAVPDVTNLSWTRTPIDRFILAELDWAKIPPAKEADRRTLIRRATLDLLGLPPTPEEVADFVNDTAEDAWERLLDRLLVSPRYGERWGRHWLDVARYADTKGYVFFEEKKYPWAYTYRDYVIRSLNGDLPYDQFVLQQLAADQLELGEDRQPLTGLGFLTVGAHFMNNTHDIIDDRIDVVSRGLLGLTVTCARCHDHKYDPISSADYYGLYGVFRSCYEPMVPPTFNPSPDTEEHRKFQAEMTTREKKLIDFVTQKHAELVADARTRAGEYLLAAYNLRDQPPTDDFMLLVDKGDLNPTMILRWQVYLNELRDKPDSIWTAWHALATLPAESFAAQVPGTLDRLTMPGESRSINRLVAESLRRAPLTSMQEVVQRYSELFKVVEQQWQELTRKADEAKQPRPTKLDDSDAEELRQVLYGENTPPQVPLAMDWGFLSLFPDRPTQGEYQKLLKETEQWMMTGAGAPPRAMVLLDAQQSYQPRVFLRGNPNRLGAPVTRKFLAALGGESKPFANGSGRLELARAIVDPGNPLAARVIVNRVWMHHFGQGLVRTPSDFGLRSEIPTHPELLDWLASELVARGWSLKWLHREIMRSAVYRQETLSAQRDRGANADPENRLLWEFPRRRLDFETQRDAMLAVANSLDLRVGGPPVEILGDAIVPRRTIYGLIDRMDVPMLMTTFDFPNPLTTSPQRSETTVAPQALYTMNNGFVREIANRLAARTDVTGPLELGQRITRQYQLCFGREPTPDELTQSVAFLTDQPTETRWQRFAHALLLANEFVFVD